MPKVTLQVSLFTCRHCGEGFNNKFSHICRIPFSELAQRSVLGGKPKQRAK